MSKVKAVGLSIAKQLFEEKRTIEEVVDGLIISYGFSEPVARSWVMKVYRNEELFNSNKVRGTRKKV